MRVDNVTPHVDQMLGDVDFHWAGFVTRPAQTRRLRQILKISEPLKKWRNQRADRPGINTSVCMSADFAIDGTRIQAGPAADAAQRFPIFPGENFTAAV